MRDSGHGYGVCRLWVASEGEEQQHHGVDVGQTSAGSQPFLQRGEDALYDAVVLEDRQPNVHATDARDQLTHETDHSDFQLEWKNS